MIQCQQDIGIGDASKAQLSNKGSPAQLANLCQYVQTCTHLGVSINMGTPNGWFTMENPISMDDVKEPLFQETFISVLCEHFSAPYHRLESDSRSYMQLDAFLDRFQRNLNSSSIRLRDCCFLPSIYAD